MAQFSGQMSSPVLQPEAEIELPSMPPLLRADSSSSLLIRGRPSRKRQLPEDDGLSSDPFFSDDTSGAEGWDAQHRSKRKHFVKGPWWTLRQTPRPSLSERHARPKRPGRKAKLRVADSGVWLGSDASHASADGLMSSQRMQELTMSDHEETTQMPVDEGQKNDALVHSVINFCLDLSQEVVDLSNLGLTRLTSESLKPLRQLLRQPHVDRTDPPNEEEFTALVPSIKLFLTWNRLSSLPAELFALENIAVLSLRNNELTAIPPYIGQLKNLKELNIASNYIRYLPWELMKFFHCGDHNLIRIRPNPLVQPTVIRGPSPLTPISTLAEGVYEGLSRWGDTREYFEKLRRRYLEESPLTLRAELELRLRLGRMLRTQYLQETSRAGMQVPVRREELIYLASSTVRYFNIDGTATGPSRADTSDVYQAVIEPNDQLPNTTSASPSMRSLFECALQSLQTACSRQDLEEITADPQLPLGVLRGLECAVDGIEYNNQSCSTCGRHFIVRRAEWMEYWFCGFPAQAELTEESVLPFLRKSCSWACASPTEPGTFKFG